jgi:hypothetical protein
MRYFLLLVTLFTIPRLFAQFSDDFEDGNFTALPIWNGDDSVFTIVDIAGNDLLRSNKILINSSYYLSTPSALASDGQWEFFTNLQFSTSSANYVDVFLTADQSNLLSPTLSGYFVRIGGTADEICLYKKIAGANTKIIDGVDGITNSTNNTLKIKVTCTALGEWKLERDLAGTGSSYFTEGLITDLSLTTSSHFGIAITHSTASFIQKHFFDDIYVGPIIYDEIPPVLISATAISATQIDVLFNEPLDQTSAENSANYDIQPFQSATVAVLDAINPSLVHITPFSPLSNGNTYTLFSSGIADISMNISGSQSVNFSYFVAENPEKGDVIINEFMADPSPVIGLPEIEYIEIYNRSGKYFDLANWKIGDGSSEGTLQSAWLSPGEHKILCATAFIDSFANSVAVTSFPSLNNSGDSVILKTNTGLVLDKLAYTDSWYNDPIKKAGGYSLELINPNDPCSGSDNWTASNSTSGGTPSLINSVYSNTPDTDLPGIQELIALAPNYLQVYFDEGMDSTSLSDALFSITPTLTITANYILESNPYMLTLQFVENILPSQNYTITIENVSDCWMNEADLTGNFILPEAPVAGDVIINEILFDPLTGGSDWIEVYNTSSKVLNLKNWQIANFDDDTISNTKIIPANFLLKPSSYVVIGKDSSHVLNNYPFAVPGHFVYSELPSLNNDSSTIYLMYNTQILDQVSYTDDWHFRLLDVTDGVSLERIDFEGNSNDINNWHSAAESVGFATPGGKNSQYYPAIETGDFSFTSETISPDSDGYEDILQVHYEMSEPGLLGTFTIYDDRGRKIIELFANELLASSGTFKWDGVTQENTKASIGTYVAVFEAFGVNGGLIFTKRKAFVVAGRL